MSKKSQKNILKIALSGASGRMGQEIQKLAKGDAMGLRIGTQINSSADWKKVKPAMVDIVVDFSLPQGMNEAIAWCVANSKPLVSGTTGLAPADLAQLKKASAKIALLYSANMSLGIAVFGEMLKAFKALPDWDFQIEEAHHSQKKDKPSGTALLLQEKLSAIVKRKLPPPNAVRGGGIPGIHQVWAMGPEEALVLQHTAFNRTVFARGALQAARWLFDKKQPGLYDLSHLYRTT